jgi:4'-phosphopantetheinyl transferase
MPRQNNPCFPMSCIQTDKVLASGLSLPLDSLHVWQVSLLQSPECVAELAQTLSPDEWARAERFHFERHRRRFIVGRGVLRKLLAGYLCTPAGEIVFSYAARGKPFLPASINSSDLRFNLAHAHEMALFAFTCQREVGIDIEHIQPLADAGAIAKRFFAAGEYQAWSELPQDQRLVGFFNCWTRKEAYIKAIGDGLSKPLDQFEVSLASGASSCLLHVDGDPQEAERWLLQALSLDVENYVAALAVENISRGPVSITTRTHLRWDCACVRA